MEAIKALFEGIAALLWPIIALAILYLFRPAIEELIQSAKSRKFTVKIFGQELNVQQALGEVESKVRVLQILVKGSITDFEYEKLDGLSRMVRIMFGFMGICIMNCDD